MPRRRRTRPLGPSRGRPPPTPTPCRPSGICRLPVLGVPCWQVKRERHEVTLQARLTVQDPPNRGGDLRGCRRIELENGTWPAMPTRPRSAGPPGPRVRRPDCRSGWKRTPSGHSTTPCSIRIDASSSNRTGPRRWLPVRADAGEVDVRKAVAGHASYHPPERGRRCPVPGVPGSNRVRSCENALSAVRTIRRPATPPLILEITFLFDLLVASVVFGLLIRGHHGLCLRR